MTTSRHVLPSDRIDKMKKKKLHIKNVFVHYVISAKLVCSFPNLRQKYSQPYSQELKASSNRMRT